MLGAPTAGSLGARPGRSVVARSDSPDELLDALALFRARPLVGFRHDVAADTQTVERALHPPQYSAEIPSWTIEMPDHLQNLRVERFRARPVSALDGGAESHEESREHVRPAAHAAPSV